MNHSKRIIIITTFFISLLLNDLAAQPWNFVKEKDGIKIYTRNEPNCSLKSFRGEVTFHAPMDKVNKMLGNAKNTDWFEKEIRKINILAFEENKFIRYYMIYAMPWPLTDRDMVSDIRITNDPLTGIQTVMAKPLFNVVPEKPGLVRISNYWQKWTVKPLDKGDVHVILEGYIDPGGSVPAWFYNLVVAELPMKTIRSLRARVLSGKPAN